MKYKGLFQVIFYLVFLISNIFLFLEALLYEKNASMPFIVFAIILLIGAALIMILKKVVNNKMTEIEAIKEIKAEIV